MSLAQNRVMLRLLSVTAWRFSYAEKLCAEYGKEVFQNGKITDFYFLFYFFDVHQLPQFAASATNVCTGFRELGEVFTPLSIGC
jgi:hypothetical protein